MYGVSDHEKVIGAYGDDTLKGSPNRDVRLEGTDTVKGGTGPTRSLRRFWRRQRSLVGCEPVVMSTNDCARDVIDCGLGTDKACYAPGQDVKEPQDRKPLRV